MDREELLELWHRNSDRPAFVRNYRDEIHEHTDLSDPIPDGSLAEVRHWMGRYKGTVTRQLGESTTTDDDETEDE